MSGRSDRGSVLVVDDDPGLRALVSDLVHGTGLPCREAATGEEAVASAIEEPPALVVLDVRLPGISGYEVCRELRDRLGEEVPIIFLSGERTDPQDRVAGLLLGADDYLVKPFAPDELLARVRGLIRRAGDAAGSRGGRDLTPRELDVLRLFARGRRQSEIAADLVISPKTVATHVANILAKLEAHTRAEAVANAYEDGVLGGDD